MKTIKIEKKELRYAFAGSLFIIVWFVWLKNLIAPTLEGMHPFIAMVLYNFGFLIGLYFIVGFLNGDHRAKTSLIMFTMFIGINVLMGPYLVTSQGVIVQDVEMWFASGDVGVASLWQSVGVSGPALWWFTYLVSGFILIFVIPIIISNPREIYKSFAT